MIIGIPKEILENEKRVAAIPSTVKEYIKKGMEVIVESGAGLGSFISDEDGHRSLRNIFFPKW